VVKVVCVNSTDVQARTRGPNGQLRRTESRDGVVGEGGRGAPSPSARRLGTQRWKKLVFVYFGA